MSDSLAEWLRRTTVNRIGNCRWFESNSYHMFELVIKAIRQVKTVLMEFIREIDPENNNYIYMLLLALV